MCCELCEEFDNLQNIIKGFFKGVNHKDMLDWKFDKYSISNGMWQEMQVGKILTCNFKWEISFIIQICFVFPINTI
jgi:hypothetical protein